ncbi:hypothetical protein LOTGIDRAFT_155008 [Lottia gigantea]|uniref:DNA-directed DNA polymerase n=1 Tax=Lottia gigantea TaxID=225164 RepID=V3ZX40_LOTGI|nr:hypothetical protein LOTGIDRAFT_155008 [Lottia gigantea]ESO85521.1 hypothetical protein LOTGIDRAFT_155008 [Lottia gigantea]
MMMESSINSATILPPYEEEFEPVDNLHWSPVQQTAFICFGYTSFNHRAWGNSSNLPMNLRKITDINIAKYTEDNCESLRHEWEPYAKRDTLCLGACLIKYNKVMKEVVFQNISNNLTAPSLSLKGWYYLYHYHKEMVEEEWYETTRMVPKHTEKENVEKVYSHTHPFIRCFIRQSIKVRRVSANRKSFKTNKMDEICNILTNKMDEICNILKEFSETRSDNIIDLFKEYSKSKKDKTEVNSKLKKIKCTKLMAFDANGLYPLVMSDLDSEYPKAESGRPFLPEENKEFVELFNEQKFRPRTAILKVWFEYPTNMLFQPIPSKDKITFTNKECNKETGIKIRFRNAFCHEVLTSVDIQEIVSSSNWDKLNEARSYLNLVKRKASDDEGIVYPYGDKDKLNLDENYEIDDFDYLTIQENEECLITQ